MQHHCRLTLEILRGIIHPPQSACLIISCCLLLWLTLSGTAFSLHAQTSPQRPAKSPAAAKAVLQGQITGPEGKGISGASILLQGTKLGMASDENGNFRLEVPPGDSLNLAFSAIGYQSRQLFLSVRAGEMKEVNITLLPQSVQLQGVDVKDNRSLDRQNEAGVTRIDPKAVQNIPSPFGDFNKTLGTLPGVVSNNELSSTYSVRGGSFDENQVYVNGIEVYRPFLVRAGQQEGLSFINPDLVRGIEFSSGGWQPEYGDKLSSVLNIQYRQPAQTNGSVTLSLLGGAAHLETGSADGRVSFIGGVREKRSQYLLNTLPVKGEYLPRFTDVQGYLHFDLSKEKSLSGLPKSELGFLFSYARNRYFTRPVNRQTTFGTLTQLRQLSVAFEGEESLEYDMYQGGLKFTRRAGERLTLSFFTSAMQTGERENATIDGTYRLCDLYGQSCTGTGSLGSQLQYVNNTLRATVLAAENRSEWVLNGRNTFKWGAKVNSERISDDLSEFNLRDSAGNSRLDDQLQTRLNLNTGRFSAFGQHTFSPDNQHRFTYGARVGYWTLNRQWLFSPVAQYTFQPVWEKEVLFKFAVGIYRQPPFYRELRDRAGQLNTGLRAQSAFHLIAGAERRLKIWERPFVLNTEAYYKNMWNVVAYDIENVRIRYFADNNTRAYATGVDFRLSGEFVKGAESWFSLGILSTKEDLRSDNRGFVRRPTDQRITAAVFFQDHLPNNPLLRVYLNAVYGTGLPFGPPRSLEYRSALNAPAYHRVDIGFSRIFQLGSGEKKRSREKSLWLGAEVLNLLGNNNVLSYTWITDVQGQQLAVPNTLSARFLNFKVILRTGQE